MAMREREERGRERRGERGRQSRDREPVQWGRGGIAIKHRGWGGGGYEIRHSQEMSLKNVLLLPWRGPDEDCLLGYTSKSIRKEDEAEVKHPDS